MAEPNIKAWLDGVAGGTPISAVELNRMEALLSRAMGGSQYLPPASPNAKNDEFDGTSTAVWSNTPTAPTTWSVNSDVPYALHLRAASAGAYVGKMQAVPAAYPYSITTLLRSHNARANYHRGGGILLAPAGATSTSQIHYNGPVWDGTTYVGVGVGRITAQMGGTFVSQAIGPRVGSCPAPLWLRTTVDSATSVTCAISQDGRYWAPFETAFNPGFTPGLMGLAASEETALGGVDAVFDFFRVT